MFLKTMIAAALTACAAASAGAAEWRASTVAPGVYPASAFAETQPHVSTVSSAGLPDGLVAVGAGRIARAWYEAPTRRYAHGILGDAVEAGALVVETANGARIVRELPQNQVFEDRYPRIADLDGDGDSEIVAIRASASGGGGVVVYGLREGRLEALAEIDDIGTPNRWLNIAAIADLTGDGALEIAFVKTPHIGGTLRVFSYRDGALTLTDEDWGYSNHAIGSPEMRLSALADVNGDGLPDLALPDASRRALKIVTLADGGIEVLAEAPLGDRVETAILADDGGFVMGLAGGRIVRVAPAK